MAKSKRRRNRDRTKRQQAAAQQQRTAARRRASAAALAEAEQRLQTLRDPESPPEAVATVLAEQYADEPVLANMAELLAD